MAIVLTDVSTYIDGHDFTTDTNQLELALEGDEIDVTHFRPAGTGDKRWREKTAGMLDASGNLSGYYNPTPTDAYIDSKLGGTAVLITQTPRETEGDVAYIHRSQLLSHERLGSIGEVTPFSMDMAIRGREGVLRGQLTAKNRTVAATGAIGTGVQLGALSGTQKLYLAVHVFTAGTTLTLEVQSDSANTFASPTTVATLSAITTTGGTFMTPVIGPITDTWFRLNATACTGSFVLAAALAIG